MANSGFAFGTPRADAEKGGRGEREQKLGLLLITGVGRPGKGPVAVPEALWRHLGDLGQGK